MKCPNCQAQVQPTAKGEGTIKMESSKGITIIFHQVPVAQCPNCRCGIPPTDFNEVAARTFKAYTDSGLNGGITSYKREKAA